MGKSISPDKSIPCLSLLEGLLPFLSLESLVFLLWTGSLTAFHIHTCYNISLPFLIFLYSQNPWKTFHTAVSSSPHLLFECMAVRLSLSPLQLHCSVSATVTSLLPNLMAHSVFTLLHPLCQQVGTADHTLLQNTSFLGSWTHILLVEALSPSLISVLRHALNSERSGLGLSPRTFFSGYRLKSSGELIQSSVLSTISMLTTPVLTPYPISKGYSKLPIQHLTVCLKAKLTLTYAKPNIQFSLSSLLISYSFSPE